MPTVLITGGTGVVGKNLIGAMLETGLYDIVYTTKSGQNIKGAKGITVDLLLEGSVDHLLERLTAENIKIDCLIHNFRDVKNLETGLSARPSTAQWQREYMAAVSIPYAITAGLQERHPMRSVIFVTSIYGITANNMTLYGWNEKAAPLHYNVAKAAQIHIAKELAVRLAPAGTRVNAVAYGGIKGRASADFENKYAELCPMKGMLDKEDIPGSVLFLLSEQSSMITGQTITVDGGWTSW